MIEARTVRTDRLRMHVYETGPADGTPVLLVHGNLSTGRFFEPVMARAPAGFRLLAPDLRGFGRTEPLPIDATRGLADWADDLAALTDALGITAPVHLLGWSTGAAAIVDYARAQEVASLTFVDPVSPHGFGGVRPDGTPCFPDFAGSGGGLHNPEFVRRLAEGDRSTDSASSPRSVLRTAYVAPSHTFPEDWEDVLVEEILLTVVGDTGYPGDSTPSPNWPFVAPGRFGVLNALSPRYCNWTDIVDLDPRPPLLWTQGDADIVVADGSAWEAGSLGAAGAVPGWPGADVYPPQQMVSEIRTVLDRYAAAGGRVRIETFAGSGHGPVLDATEKWCAVFYNFLSSAHPST